MVIGVTSDEFVRKEGKVPDLNYEERVRDLKTYLDGEFPDRKYAIAELHDNFGPGIESPQVEAIVVSPETVAKVPIANKLRAERGYRPLDVVVVDWVVAEDGKTISSTRIRRAEIDSEGRPLKGENS